MSRGLFLAFEGPEGAGKSIQIQRLARSLDERGVPNLTTREPGGTPTGEAIREHVWKRTDLEIDGITELFLLSAARHVHVREVIEPALARGEVVISDRFALSTVVYQGHGRGVDVDVIGRVTEIATGGLEPDLYIVLDVPVEIGRARQEATGERPDRIELEDRAFMERVREGYRQFGKGARHAVVVDAAASADTVHAHVHRALAERYPAWFAGAGNG